MAFRAGVLLIFLAHLCACDSTSNDRRRLVGHTIGSDDAGRSDAGGIDMDPADVEPADADFGVDARAESADAAIVDPSDSAPPIEPDASHLGAPDLQASIDQGPIEADGCAMANESCDGIDNDCDGSVDEGFALGEGCDLGVGACSAVGVFVCNGAGGLTCNAVPGAPGDEACNAIDDDCDGAVDEDFSVDAACHVGLGACRAAGRLICAPDGTARCDAVPGMASDEVCDAVDNDCDGDTDESVLNACGACGPAPEEACDAIDNDCDGEIDEGVTNACGVCGPAPEELCDAIDNDCDGETDEGVTNVCGVCGPVPEEVCDDLDNDCDGKVDEGVTNACGLCGPVPEEVCDDLDNDCDGETDEGTLNACGQCLPRPPEPCERPNDDPLPIGQPGEIIAFDGALDGDDPVWRRATARCELVEQGTYLYEVTRIINSTGAPQRITLTASWHADGYLFVFTDPFDAEAIDGCIAGDDDFMNVRGSRIPDVQIAPGQVLAVVASTFGADVIAGDYRIEVLTQRAAVCGDGEVELGEGCDDGNVVDGDGCDALCQVEPPALCGNGVLDIAEDCDDGNQLAGDGCSEACELECRGDRCQADRLAALCAAPPANTRYVQQGCRPVEATAVSCPILGPDPRPEVFTGEPVESIVRDDAGQITQVRFEENGPPDLLYRQVRSERVTGDEYTGRDPLSRRWDAAGRQTQLRTVSTYGPGLPAFLDGLRRSLAEIQREQGDEDYCYCEHVFECRWDANRLVEVGQRNRLESSTNFCSEVRPLDCYSDLVSWTGSALYDASGRVEYVRHDYEELWRDFSTYETFHQYDGRGRVRCTVSRVMDEQNLEEVTIYQYRADCE